MNSPFKFPRRVRIHGGECGAVARALHHEVRGSSLCQADSGKALGSTIERKQMSTKTTLLKRIAQTAVVALLGGLLGTVATPAASAASNPNATVSATCVIRDGVGGFIRVTMGGFATGTAKVRAAGQSYVAKNNLTAGGSAGMASALTSAVLSTGHITESSSSTIIIPLSGESTTNLSSINYLVWLDVNGNESTTATMTAASPSTAVTCNDGGPVASWSLSSTTASATAGDTVTFTVTPKGATFDTILRPGSETFTVVTTASAGRSQTVLGKYVAGSSPTAVVGGYGIGDTSSVTTALLTGTNGTLYPIASTAAGNMPSSRGLAPSSATTLSHSFLVSGAMADGLPTFRQRTTGPDLTESATSGTFTINTKAESNTTTTVVVKGASGIAESISSTFTLTTAPSVYGTSYGVGSSAAIVVPGFGIVKSGTGWSATASTVGLVAPTPATTTGAATASGTLNVSTARTTIPLTVQMSQAGTFSYTVAAVTGYSLPSGVTAGTYTYTSPTGVETQAALSWTVASLTDGQRFTVTWADAANSTMVATFVVAAPKVGSSDGSVTLRDTASSKKYDIGATITNVATVRDQYGSLVEGADVQFSVAGRNIKSATTVKSGSNGTASYSWTDASTSTTSLTDTLNVSVTSGNSGSFATASTSYTNVQTALAASNITVATNAASTGVAANGAVTLTIKVTNSSGAGLSGYPVAISVDNKSFATATGGLTANAYTDANGDASATIWAKTVGTSTVSVTSAGKTASVTYAIIAAAHRTLSVDAATVAMSPSESKRVTATVKDSFGNVDPDVAVTVAYVGTAGRVASVNGVQTSSCTTDVNGQCVIEIVSEVAGTGTLTLTMTGGDSALTVLNDGSSRPARVLTTSTAVTITGSSAVTVAAEAAADAAAEAIDAANAATDAANLAAEAADAATVAAEEARDAADAATAAVEELATQVATLMAALKAQITTLANTVAKIAKKVRA